MQLPTASRLLDLNDQHLDSFFDWGFVVGALYALVAACVIFLLIQLLFFLRRRCRGVSIKSPNGELFISAVAVGDVVTMVARRFKDFSLRKCGLHQRGFRYYLRLRFDLDSAELNLPQLTSELRDEILKALSVNFGIDSVEKVDIHVGKIRHRPSRSPEPTAPSLLEDEPFNVM